MFIDTHCHLDSGEFDGKIEAILQSCKSQGVEYFIIPGASIGDLKKAILLAEANESIYFSVGIHPNEAESLDDSTLDFMADSALHKKCLAIGEIGLDYHYNNDAQTKKTQEIALRTQINLAIKLKKPIIIHTRESTADIMKILKDYESDLGSVIFHCFSGDMELVGALKCKCYYGIGGVISFKNARILHENARKLPLDSIILETDAPYLAPTPHRGKTNSPEFIPLIASHLAQNLNVSVEKIAEITTQNAFNAFKFN